MQRQSVRNQILNKPILLPLMTSDTTIGCFVTTCEADKTTTKPNVRVMGSHGKPYRNFFVKSQDLHHHNHSRGVYFQEKYSA